MAQLSDLITRVKYNIGGRTDKDAVITDALNQSLIDAAEFADFRDLKDTKNSTMTINTNYHSFSSTIRKVESVSLKDSSSNYHNVEIVGKSLFRNLFPDIIPSNTGIPTHCYIEGYYLYFDKKAQEAYEVYVDGYLYPNAMSLTTDSPDIVGIDSFLIAQATAYVFASLKQFDSAQFWFAVANEKLRRKVSETMVSRMGQIIAW